MATPMNFNKLIIVVVLLLFSLTVIKKTTFKQTPLASHQKTNSSHAAKSEKIIKTLKIGHINPEIIPETRFATKNGKATYTDEDLGLSFPIPKNWTVYRYDSDGLVTVLTNQIITLDGKSLPERDYKKTQIFFGIGHVFSTSGALCGNGACPKIPEGVDEEITIEVAGKKYATKFVGNRFEVIIDGYQITTPRYSEPIPLSITVNLGNKNDLETVREILKETVLNTPSN